jgi:hypothetical protein
MVISIRVLTSSTCKFKMMVAGGDGVVALGDTAGSSRQPTPTLDHFYVPSYTPFGSSG